jgi:dTDP-4-dehydrorhamnose reductase
MVPPSPILVTGGAGRLARALARVGGDQMRLLTRRDLDICDPEAIDRTFQRLGPAAVINTAAVSSIEAAEQDPELGWAVNAVAPGHLARAAARSGAPMIHISSDYVFGADTDRPWRETDPPSPINAYGRQKAEGELRVLEADGRNCVVRVAWLFGDGEDFISRMLAGAPGGPVVVADDQLGSPTPIYDLAARLIELVGRLKREASCPAVLHLVGSPPVTRADWVATAFAALGDAGVQTPELVRVPMSTFSSAVQRPRLSALDATLSARMFGSALDWRPLASTPGTFLRSG